MHTPVLLKEAIEGLNVKPEGLYIDATVGEGGHLFEIAKSGGKVLGVDLDNSQLGKLKIQTDKYKNITLCQGNFADIETIARQNEFYPVDGILLDLGLSIAQIENSRRGFSYKKVDEPLDMRINTDYETTASELVNSLNESALYDTLARYGEDINSLKISQEIIKQRQKRKIERVGDLLLILDTVLGTKDNRTYARIFQALRIAVNDELENLKKGLNGAAEILKKNGRVVVISFHSLEDRIVKQFAIKRNFRQLNKKVKASGVKKKFERSARIRIIENS